MSEFEKRRAEMQARKAEKLRLEEEQRKIKGKCLKIFNLTNH